MKTFNLLSDLEQNKIYLTKLERQVKIEKNGYSIMVNIKQTVIVVVT